MQLERRNSVELAGHLCLPQEKEAYLSRLRHMSAELDASGDGRVSYEVPQAVGAQIRFKARQKDAKRFTRPFGTMGFKDLDIN
eukprot:2640583-Amphidinium_carterae.1